MIEKASKYVVFVQLQDVCGTDARSAIMFRSCSDFALYVFVRKVELSFFDVCHDPCTRFDMVRNNIDELVGPKIITTQSNI